MTTAGLLDTPAWQWTSTLCWGNCSAINAEVNGRCGTMENSSSS